MIVYMLKAQHEHFYDGTAEVDDFLIGFFDSIGKCEAIEQEYKTKAGFSLPDVFFSCTPWPCSDEEMDSPGFIYYVAHSFMDAGGWEDNDDIGVFASMKEAEVAKNDYISTGKAGRRRLNGKAEEPYLLNQTDIIKYEINKKYWTDGFTTD